MNDMSSVYADSQGIGSVVAAQLAVDDFSAKMGVPIEIVSADHQNKPDAGAAIARRWIDEDHVDVIMDLPNSAVALAVLAVAKRRTRRSSARGPGPRSDRARNARAISSTGPMTPTPGALAWARLLTEAGGKKWFFITADYAFGKDIEANCAAAIKAAGGEVVGSVRHPINAADFSSFVLQAQNSGADVVAFANGGGDTNNCFKQAHEFGLADKQKLVGLTLNVHNVPRLVSTRSPGAPICTAFYWDENDGTRAFAKRFQAAHPKHMMPNDMHAGMYAATEHLIKALAVTKSASDGVKLVDEMKALPTDDALFGKGSIRVDGRKLHPMYLYRAKTPAELKYDWDYFALVSTIKPEDAFRPLDKGGCPFVKA